MQHPPPSFEFTPAARAALVRVCARSGPQAIVLSWPAGITYLPARCYRRAEFDVALARFEECAVYADSRGLTLFLNRHVVVDAERTARPRAWPVLRVRSLPEGGDRHESLVPDGGAKASTERLDWMTFSGENQLEHDFNIIW